MPYAWPLGIGPRSDQIDVAGTARERRTAQGMWRHKEGACLVLGPTHGPVCLRLGVPVVPSRAEAAQGLASLDWRCPVHLTSLHETALIAPNRATFATALPAAPFCTVLIAHMDWPAHQTVLLILPTAIVVGPLPIRPRSLCRRPARDWRDGDVITVTEVADSAIPAYEAMAAAEIPHSIPICPPASASGQALLAQPVRIPSLTVARADTPAGEHIGWTHVPRPRPQRPDEPSSSADGSGLSLLQTNARLIRTDKTAAGLSAAHSREQKRFNTVPSAADHCPTLNPPALAPVVPTPLGRRRLAGVPSRAQLADMQPNSVPPPVAEPSTEADLVDGPPVPCPLHIDEALSPPTDDQSLRQAVHFLRAPWQNFWRGDLCSLPGLPACFLRALHCCVPALDTVQHVHLFTDGSFIAGSSGAKCGWGICAVFEGLCQQQRAFAFAGFAGGPLETFLQRPVGALNTSYFAEAAAAIVAVAWQLSLPACVPATLWYDCQAVGGVINGHMAPKAGQGCLSLASRLRSVVHLVESVRGNACRAVWLPSHAGNPFNELADCVPKPVLGCRLVKVAWPLPSGPSCSRLCYPGPGCCQAVTLLCRPFPTF